jgi:hypothetical protein
MPEKPVLFAWKPPMLQPRKGLVRMRLKHAWVGSNPTVEAAVRAHQGVSRRSDMMRRETKFSCKIMNVSYSG